MARGRSLAEFQKLFPDEESCAAFLIKRRWPDGFVCPGCGKCRAVELKSRAGKSSSLAPLRSSIAAAIKPNHAASTPNISIRVPAASASP
jgi:hypothetical protein